MEKYSELVFYGGAGKQLGLGQNVLGSDANLGLLVLETLAQPRYVEQNRLKTSTEMNIGGPV